MPDGTTPELVTRADALLVRELREGSREADFVASTEAIDSYGEVIDQSSWILDHYKANPVALYGHMSRELPIGQCVRIGVVDGRLECTIRFATEDANPQAERVWKLLKEKVLRAVSVGFVPKDGKYELRDGREVWVWYSCILKEISVVAVPANHQALAKMRAAFAAKQSRDKSNAGDSQPQPSAAHASDESNTAGDGESTRFEMNEKELREALDKAEKALEAERAAAKTAAEKAQEGHTKALADADARIKTLESEKATLEKEHAKACADRDAAQTRASELEDKLHEREVDDLVGKKITAAEKAEFLELRKSNEKLFRSMIEKRADLNLTERVTQPDEKEAGTQPTVAKAPDQQVAEFWAAL